MAGRLHGAGLIVNYQHGLQEAMSPPDVPRRKTPAVAVEGMPSLIFYNWHMATGLGAKTCHKCVELVYL